MIDDVLTLSDGRRVSYTDCGIDAGPTVVYFHGTPTSRTDQTHLDALFAEWGVRVISADRPGHGHSTIHPGRSFVDTAGDTAEIADLLGVEQFAVWGASTGGPHAVACAALLADRVVGLCCMGGMTDPAWDGYWVGVPPEAEAIMRRGDEDAMVERMAGLFGADGSGFPFGADGLPPVDAALFDDAETSARFRQGVDECFRQGVAGMAHDTVVRAQPWASSFDPAVITASTWMYHGEQDTIRPVSHSEHTASLISTAQLVTFPQHGHLSVGAETPTLIADLVRPLR